MCFAKRLASVMEIYVDTLDSLISYKTSVLVLPNDKNLALNLRNLDPAYAVAMQRQRLRAEFGSERCAAASATASEIATCSASKSYLMFCILTVFRTLLLVSSRKQQKPCLS